MVAASERATSAGFAQNHRALRWNRRRSKRNERKGACQRCLCVAESCGALVSKQQGKPTRVGASQVRVRALLLAELGEGARGDERVLHELVLFCGAIHDVDVLGLHELDILFNVVVDGLDLDVVAAVPTERAQAMERHGSAFITSRAREHRIGGEVRAAGREPEQHGSVQGPFGPRVRVPQPRSFAAHPVCPMFSATHGSPVAGMFAM